MHRHRSVRSEWLSLPCVVRAGTLATELKGDGRITKDLYSKAVVTDGKWHRVGLVLSHAGRTLYVDGVAVAQDTQNNITGSYNSLHIGAGRNLSAGGFWGGLIDDVHICNCVVKP